jgi:hypothetical protein
LRLFGKIHVGIRAASVASLMCLHRALLVLLLLLLIPARVQASWERIRCRSKLKTIHLLADSNIEIAYLDNTTGKREGLLERPVSLQPDHPQIATAQANVILAIPISRRKVLAEEKHHLHVVHQDGTSCNGRERWLVRYAQSFVFAASDGSPPFGTAQFQTLKFEGQTKEGYIVAEMICTDEGVTSPGGCRVEDDRDAVTDVRDK